MCCEEYYNYLLKMLSKIRNIRHHSKNLLFLLYAQSNKSISLKLQLSSPLLSSTISNIVEDIDSLIFAHAKLREVCSTLFPVTQIIVLFWLCRHSEVFLQLFHSYHPRKKWSGRLLVHAFSSRLRSCSVGQRTPG